MNYGLYISHGGPVVVNPSTVIGDNCNLSQFVTIGSNEGKAAVIGDNVYIGPNTCIVEDGDRRPAYGAADLPDGGRMEAGTGTERQRQAPVPDPGAQLH